jgi:hypothetical protein
MHNKNNQYIVTYLRYFEHQICNKNQSIKLIENYIYHI